MIDCKGCKHEKYKPELKAGKYAWQRGEGFKFPCLTCCRYEWGDDNFKELGVEVKGKKERMKALKKLVRVQAEIKGTVSVELCIQLMDRAYEIGEGEK